MLPKKCSSHLKVSSVTIRARKDDEVQEEIVSGIRQIAYQQSEERAAIDKLRNAVAVLVATYESNQRYEGLKRAMAKGDLISRGIGEPRNAIRETIEYTEGNKPSK